MNDPEYPFRGDRPDWDVPPPPWVCKRPLWWYRERSLDLDAVLAAAETVAARTTEART